LPLNKNFINFALHSAECLFAHIINVAA